MTAYPPAYLISGNSSPVHLADYPFAQGSVGQTVGHLQPEIYHAGMIDRVCQIGGIAGLIKVVAVVTQQLADSQALGVKVADRKWITPMYLGL